MSNDTTAVAGTSGLPVRSVSFKYGAGLAMLATICWSTTGLFIEVVSRDYHLTPVELSLWRIILIILLLGPLVWKKLGWDGFKLSRREIALYGINGVVGIALFNIAWSGSVQYNGAAVATTLLYCAPVFVALGSWPLLGESISLAQMLAIGVNILGCALVSGAYNLTAFFNNPAGLLIGIAGGATFGFYTLVGKLSSRDAHYNGLVGLFYVFVFGCLALLPIRFLENTDRPLVPTLDLSGWLLLIGLALGPTLGGYAFFTFSLKYFPASIAILFTTLEPPIAAVFAWLLLGRVMNGVQWVGVALIVGAVVMLQLRGMQQRRQASKINLATGALPEP